MDAGSLAIKANEIRIDIVSMIAKAGSGHPGGSLSCTDILTALYFGDVMKHDPADPKMEGRDRFFLAKGHAAPALYATLAHAGYFPREELSTLRKLGSRLQGHPDSSLVPASRCRPALSARACPSPQVARAACVFQVTTRACSPCSATVSARRARFGKRPCSPPMRSSATSSPSSITTDFRSTAGSATCATRGPRRQVRRLRLGRRRGRRPRHGSLVETFSALKAAGGESPMPSSLIR